MHFAANALVGESMTNPGKYFHNNVANGLKLLDAAVACSVKKFVFSSTCATYGPPDRVPMTEDLPQRPINPYGESKLMFEKMLQWYEKIHGLEFIAFRYFNAAGASERFGEHHRVETHLIPNVLKVALGQKTQCEIYGTDYPTPDGTCIRDYIHIRDLAQAHILGLAPGKRGFYNLGNGDGYSVREVIRMCERVTGKAIPAVEKPRRPGDPPKLVAAAGKAIEELGWKPQFPKLEDIVTTAWAWHKSHPEGYTDRVLRKVLLVDDDPFVLRVYQGWLSQRGVHVDTASDGFAAIQALRACRPDLVVLDLMMPKFTGLDVLKFLRAQADFAELPVIVLSNHYMNEMARQAVSLGVEKALLKVRCSPPVLMGIINELFAGKPTSEDPSHLLVVPGEAPADRADSAAPPAPSPAAPFPTQTEDQGATAQFQAKARHSLLENASATSSALRSLYEAFTDASNPTARVGACRISAGRSISSPRLRVWRSATSLRRWPARWRRCSSSWRISRSRLPHPRCARSAPQWISSVCSLTAPATQVPRWRPWRRHWWWTTTRFPTGWWSPRCGAPGCMRAAPWIRWWRCNGSNRNATTWCCWMSRCQEWTDSSFAGGCASRPAMRKPR